MEATKIEKLCNAVRTLIKEQKLQATKILELEKKLDIAEKYSKQTEKALEDEKDQIDKRFDCALERFDLIDPVIEEHNDSIEDLEKKSGDIAKKLNTLNESIQNMNIEIKDLETKVKSEDKKDSNPENKQEIKQCRYDRVGYCKKGVNKCKFLHVSETCTFYLENGFCNKLRCLQRHPRKCTFFERGHCKRNDCKYLHRTGIQKECANCEISSRVTYFCEHCEKSYCNNCTVKDAHVREPYKSNDLVGCMDIHN